MVNIYYCLFFPTMLMQYFEVQSVVPVYNVYTVQYHRTLNAVIVNISFIMYLLATYRAILWKLHDSTVVDKQAYAKGSSLRPRKKLLLPARAFSPCPREYGRDQKSWSRRVPVRRECCVLSTQQQQHKMTTVAGKRLRYPSNPLSSIGRSGFLSMIAF